LLREDGDISHDAVGEHSQRPPWTVIPDREGRRQAIKWAHRADSRKLPAGLLETRSMVSMATKSAIKKLPCVDRKWRLDQRFPGMLAGRGHMSPSQSLPS